MVTSELVLALVNASLRGMKVTFQTLDEEDPLLAMKVTVSYSNNEGQILNRSFSFTNQGLYLGKLPADEVIAQTIRDMTSEVYKEMLNAQQARDQRSHRVARREGSE